MSPPTSPPPSPQPFPIPWNEMPLQAKEAIVQTMDLKTRINMRQTSYNIRFELDEMKLDLHQFCISLGSSECVLVTWRTEHGESSQYFRRFISFFELFIAIFSTRKLTIQVFLVDFEDRKERKHLASDEEMMMFLINIQQVFAFRREKVHVQRFCMALKSKEEQLLTFLPFLEPGVLEHIELGSNYPMILRMDTVCLLDQWRMARGVNMYQIIACLNIRDFWNFHFCHVSIPRLSLDDITLLVNHYQRLPVVFSCIWTPQANPAVVERILGFEPGNEEQRKIPKRLSPNLFVCVGKQRLVFMNAEKKEHFDHILPTSVFN